MEKTDIEIIHMLRNTFNLIKLETEYRETNIEDANMRLTVLNILANSKIDFIDSYLSDREIIEDQTLKSNEVKED